MLSYITRTAYEWCGRNVIGTKIKKTFGETIKGKQYSNFWAEKENKFRCYKHRVKKSQGGYIYIKINNI
jgi:hypothetical protein